FGRVGMLCRLLDLLLAQAHPSFEVVVVEQSIDVEPADRARLASLERDPRLRVLRHPPLGGAGARNVGARAARGDILLFIDDDDLPDGTGWIAAHAALYADPDCLGATGRHVHRPGEAVPYRSAARAARRCMRFSPLLKLPWTYARHDRRVVGVDSVHGTNGSIRRNCLERFGGWDEDAGIEDEASFGFRVARGRRAGEYLCFDPSPVVVRGQDAGGGLGKRFMTAGGYYERLLGFCQRVIGRYHPWRVRLLFPLYALALWGWTVDWLFGESRGHRATWRRLAASAGLLLSIPFRGLRSLARHGIGGPTGSDTGSP
ncbi:MAG TPA: glycosyltransferase family 2 protein, partial [Candidatus Acidoferrum sp.]|nr:glycosyltransferase family 2 protein [Candidatus Acidoferrum sp.]